MGLLLLRRGDPDYAVDGLTHRPDAEGLSHVPQDWLRDFRLADRVHWHENEVFAGMDVKEKYDRVISEFEAVLAEHGTDLEVVIYLAAWFASAPSSRAKTH